MTGVWADLADLLLPAECAGCLAARTPLRYGVCAACVSALEALRPRAVRPSPAPPGLPACVALGGYDGQLREALLSYKERGRHGLARPLGLLLAEVVATTVGQRRPVLLVPVPATARAARTRHGDHLRRLARHAAGGLRRAGWPVEVGRPLIALPRPDSVALDAVGRSTAAASAFRLRPGRVAALRRSAAGRGGGVLDDNAATRSTMAALNRPLAGGGVTVHAAAVLAATRRRHAG